MFGEADSSGLVAAAVTAVKCQVVAVNSSLPTSWFDVPGTSSTTTTVCAASSAAVDRRPATGCTHRTTGYVTRMYALHDGTSLACRHDFVRITGLRTYV